MKTALIVTILAELVGIIFLLLAISNAKRALADARFGADCSLRLLEIERNASRYRQAETLYAQAIHGGTEALQLLGAFAGRLTVFNQPPFATQAAREYASKLYDSARSVVAVNTGKMPIAQ